MECVLRLVVFHEWTLEWFNLMTMTSYIKAVLEYSLLPSARKSHSFDQISTLSTFTHSLVSANFSQDASIEAIYLVCVCCHSIRFRRCWPTNSSGSSSASYPHPKHFSACCSRPSAGSCSTGSCSHASPSSTCFSRPSTGGSSTGSCFHASPFRASSSGAFCPKASPFYSHPKPRSSDASCPNDTSYPNARSSDTSCPTASPCGASAYLFHPKPSGTKLSSSKRYSHIRSSGPSWS